MGHTHSPQKAALPSRLGFEMSQLNFPPAADAGSEPELANVDLTSRGSSVSQASTIYDPAAFEVDPKFKEQQEQAEIERQRLEKMGVTNGNGEAAIDIADGPGSPIPGKNPFRDPEEDDDALIDESPVCCCGFISLKLAVVVVNSFLAVLGAVSLIVGITAFATGSRSSSEGFSALDALLLSGPFYINVACCVAGIGLIAAGAMGLVLRPQIVHGHANGGRKVLFLIYQSTLLLSVIVFTLLTILNGVAIVKVKSKQMYDTGHWIGTIEKDPSGVCDIETRLNCAGFDAVDECSIPFSRLSQRMCPGHFCFDFCRVGGEQTENTIDACKVCKDGFDYSACKKFESETSSKQACQEPLNNSISTSYNDSLAILVVILLGTIVALCVAGFRGCCMPVLAE